MTDATRNLLEQHFDTAFAAPDGIKKLRELILTLAMQGKLAPQDPNDPPASELLKQIEAEKQRLHASSSSPRKRGSRSFTPLDPRSPSTRGQAFGDDGIKTKSVPSIKPEEVPYELPQGWVWVRLGNICSYIQRGKGPKYVDLSTHQVISQKCIRWYGLDLEPARYIDSTSLEKYEPIRFLRVGDLLWNSTGTGTIGRACLVPKELEGVEIVADSHVTVVRVIEVNPIFLWRWVQSPIVQNEIEGSASGTTNQIELNTSTIINHLIPLPPLPEQHRIVAKIDQLMAKCDELEALRKAREEKRRAVHAAAIRQLLDTTSSFPQACSRADGERESSSSKESNLRSPSTREQAYGGNGVSAHGWNFIQQHFGELYTVKENVAELRKTILQLAVMGRLVPQDPNDPPASELLKEIEAEKQRLHASSSSPRRRGSSGLKDLDPRSPSTRGQAFGDDGIKTKSVPPIKPEEVPYELPQGWEWVRLGQLSPEYQNGISKRNSSDGCETIVLRLADIVANEVSLGDTRSIQLTEKELEKYFLSDDDILITRVNGSVDLVGSFIRVKQIQQTLAYCDHFIRMKLPLNFVDAGYLHIISKGALIRHQIEDKFVTTAGQKTVNQTHITTLMFPLPPLPEQHRIVAKIDQLMTLCDRLEQQIDAATGKQTELLNAVMAAV